MDQKTLDAVKQSVKYNSHDFGEMGKFIRIGYVYNILQDLFTKEHGVPCEEGLKDDYPTSSLKLVDEKKTLPSEWVNLQSKITSVFTAGHQTEEFLHGIQIDTILRFLDALVTENHLKMPKQ